MYDTNLQDIVKNRNIQILYKFITKKQREYLLLYYLGEYTMREIAQMYGVTESTISRTLKRAKENMYDIIDIIERGYLKNGRYK